MLEECASLYGIPVNIRAGDQFKRISRDQAEQSHSRDFVDHAPSDGGEPFSVFENRRHPDLSRR